MGGRFCLSDDSHGVAQVGAKYHEMLKFVKEQGIQKLHFLELAPEETSEAVDSRFPRTIQKSCSLAEVEELEYWKR